MTQEKNAHFVIIDDDYVEPVENLKRMFIRTELNDYLVQWSDGLLVDGKTNDIRFYRIFMRKDDGCWCLRSNDFCFGCTQEKPIDMFMGEVGDQSAVMLEVELTEWQYDTILGNFQKKF